MSLPQQSLNTPHTNTPEPPGGLNVVRLDALDVVRLRGAEGGHELLQLPPERLRYGKRRGHLGNPVSRTQRAVTPLPVILRHNKEKKTQGQ